MLRAVSLRLKRCDDVQKRRFTKGEASPTVRRGLTTLVKRTVLRSWCRGKGYLPLLTKNVMLIVVFLRLFLRNNKIYRFLCSSHLAWVAALVVYYDHEYGNLVIEVS